MKILGFFISLYLLLVGSVYAQNTKLDSIKRERDWRPSQVFLSADIFGLTRLKDQGNLLIEFQAKVDFDIYFLALDAGYMKSNLNHELSNYDASGFFYRVGPQVDFMPYNRHWSNMYFGFMYGWSTFSDDITYQTVESTWPSSNRGISNSKLKAQWVEANFGLSAHIIGPLYMGYVLRFKFGRKISGFDELIPWEIPGYGRADRTGRFGFNYHITYRFGYRDKKVPVKIE